jgi:TolB-like protein/Tfp pilus assembly protein PilF
MDFNKLYRELIRRNVFRAVLAYLAVAWVLIEASSTILPTFGAPEYIIKGLIYLLGIGLVIWTGFSWVYDLTPEGIRRTPEEYDTTETRALNSRRLNAVIVGAGISAVLVLLAGSFWAGSQWNNANKIDASPEYRIAVLPFVDRSDNAEYEYLREGLAEDVIRKLFDFSGVSVISSMSTFKFKDSNKSIEQISRELNADVVLVGTYSVTNKDIDVKVEVIDTKDNKILNYASIIGDLGHVRDISFEIGQQLQESLNIPDPETDKKGSVVIREVNPEAFKLNALGKSAMRDHTGQNLEDITRYFEAAIDLDPTYFDPYLGMAEAYLFEVNRGYLSSAEATEKARDFALKAEKLDPGRGEVSGIMGIIHFFEFEFKSAMPYFEKSLEKSPNFGPAYHYYSLMLEFLGEFEKAEQLQKKAGLLDPLNAMNDTYMILNNIYQDKFDQAEERIEKNLLLDPGHMQMLWLKAVLWVEKGAYQKAHETMLKRGTGLETNFISGYAYARIGQEAKARLVLKNMLAKPFTSPAQLAIVYCGLGDYELALDCIEEAYLLHDGWIKWVMWTSMADPVKDDPRYRSIREQFRWDQI